MTDTLIDFPTPSNATSDAELAAKAAVISQRIAQKLAIEKDMHDEEKAMMMDYIAATKLMQGAVPLVQRARIARQRAKQVASLRELGDVLQSVRVDAKAADGRTAPVTFEESLALLQAGNDS